MSALIDLNFRGQPRVIASAVLQAADGLVIVDPGPTTCLAALETGLAGLGATLGDVRHILLTHIHLDHAGATGTILARVPQARVYVHERGAPHMIDPQKLLASAARLYGDQMDVLWGRFDPVPASQVTVLGGGERLDIRGPAIEVRYTPGHAVHHVSYLDEAEGTAYVGDTCGIRVMADYTIAATPPPDIDVDLWQASLNLIGDWRPETLFLTHFGPVSDAASHLEHYRRVLGDAADLVARSLAAGGADEDRIADFVSRMRADARDRLAERDAVALELAAPFDQIWAGLARYWRKKAA
jgi:glyoxylase-like metal-dependent hydrolase (beta-lactamase superfamily II)